jgi:hypothetical protein
MPVLFKLILTINAFFTVTYIEGGCVERTAGPTVHGRKH